MRTASDSDVLTPSAAETVSGLRSAVGLAAVVVMVDHLTKWWAVARLEDGPCSPESCVYVFGSSVRFHLVYNTGAAFSTGEGYGWILGPLALAMAIYLLWLANRETDKVSIVALASVAGGALGNLVDRVVRAEGGFLNGGVVDFIDFRFWPVFNVADMAVVAGIAVLILRQTLTLSGSRPGAGDSLTDLDRADQKSATDATATRATNEADNDTDRHGQQA